MLTTCSILCILCTFGSSNSSPILHGEVAAVLSWISSAHGFRPDSCAEVHHIPFSFDLLSCTEEKPDQGELKLGKTAAPMYVEQMREDLDGESTVFEELTDGLDSFDIGGREVNSRAYCSWFNFKGKIQQRTVSSLSGGERNRLQLAKTLRLGGNLLMLDEPSNDLDVETLRALETAIENFAGTVLCISHDRWFLDRIATHIIAYEGDSEVRFFEGSYTEYEEDLLERTGSRDPTQVKYKPMPTFA